MSSEEREYMIVGKQEVEGELRITGHLIKGVNVYRYLGGVISNDAKIELKNRITKYRLRIVRHINIIQTPGTLVDIFLMYDWNYIKKEN